MQFVMLRNCDIVEKQNTQLVSFQVFTLYRCKEFLAPKVLAASPHRWDRQLVGCTLSQTMAIPGFLLPNILLCPSIHDLND